MITYINKIENKLDHLMQMIAGGTFHHSEYRNKPSAGLHVYRIDETRPEGYRYEMYVPRNDPEFSVIEDITR